MLDLASPALLSDRLASGPRADAGTGARAHLAGTVSPWRPCNRSLISREEHFSGRNSAGKAQRPDDEICRPPSPVRKTRLWEQYPEDLQDYRAEFPPLEVSFWAIG